MSLAPSDTPATSKSSASGSIVIQTQTIIERINLAPTSTEYQQDVDTAIQVQGSQFSGATQATFAQTASSSSSGPLPQPNGEIYDSPAGAETDSRDLYAGLATPEPEEQHRLSSPSSTIGLELAKYRPDIDTNHSVRLEPDPGLESSESQTGSEDSTLRPSKPWQSDTGPEVCRPAEATNMPPPDLVPDNNDSERTTSIKDPSKHQYLKTGRNYYVSGKVIHVPSDSRYSVLANRAFIILTISHEGYAQCLSICHHNGRNRDWKGTRTEFFQAHAQVHSTQAAPLAHEKLAYAPIKVVMDESEDRVLQDCFVNLEHTWTIRTDVTKVASIGMVVGRLELLRTYQQVQSRMITKEIETVEKGN